MKLGQSQYHLNLHPIKQVNKLKIILSNLQYIKPQDVCACLCVCWLCVCVCVCVHVCARACVCITYVIYLILDIASNLTGMELISNYIE